MNEHHRLEIDLLTQVAAELGVRDPHIILPSNLHELNRYSFLHLARWDQQLVDHGHPTVLCLCLDIARGVAHNAIRTYDRDRPDVCVGTDRLGPESELAAPGSLEPADLVLLAARSVLESRTHRAAMNRLRRIPAHSYALAIGDRWDLRFGPRVCTVWDQSGGIGTLVGTAINPLS